MSDNNGKIIMGYNSDDTAAIIENNESTITMTNNSSYPIYAYQPSQIIINLRTNTILTGGNSGSDNRYSKIISSQYYGRYIKILVGLIEDDDLFDTKMTLEDFLFLVLKNIDDRKIKEGD